MNVKLVGFKSNKVSLLSLALVLVMGITVVACGDDGRSNGDGPFDLIFDGQAFGPHDGQTLHVALVDASNDAVLFRDSTVVGSGGFSFSWDGVLAAGKAYRLDYYADVNGNTECETTDDHYWSTSISSVSSDVTVSETHDTDFDQAACLSFDDPDVEYDLTFTGTGFGPHDGQTLFVSVLRIDNDNVVEEGSTEVSGGSFSFSWALALEEGKSFHIDYYADVDADLQCDEATDHFWRETIQNVSSNQVVDATHSLNFNPGTCAAF